MQVLFTTRTRRLASTPQAEASLPAGRAAQSSRQALQKLQPAGLEAGGRADSGCCQSAAPKQLSVLDVLSGPYTEPSDHSAACVQGALTEAGTA